MANRVIVNRPRIPFKDLISKISEKVNSGSSGIRGEVKYELGSTWSDGGSHGRYVHRDYFFLGYSAREENCQYDSDEEAHDTAITDCISGLSYSLKPLVVTPHCVGGNPRSVWIGKS